MPAETQRIDGNEFLAVTRAALASGDAQALADEVTKYWTPRQLCRLLTSQDADVRRVVAVTLGLVGDTSCTGCLARALHDADESVSAMAEHGLWSIWFRSGRACAAASFAAGVASMEQEAYTRAILKFEEAAGADPGFAEAYHQCALAHFFLGQWDECISDSRRTLERMPTHFGAMAGMGHAHLQLGQIDEALCCYRRALAIHPRLPDIQEAIERLERAVCDRKAMTASRARS